VGNFFFPTTFRLLRNAGTKLILPFIHSAKGNKEKYYSHDKSDKYPIGNTETKHLASSLTPHYKSNLGR